MIRLLKKLFSLILTLLLLGSYSSLLFSENSTYIQGQLQQLEKQINQLKQNLDSVHDKQGLLNKELASTEKQIGSSVHQLRILQREIDLKQEKIKGLKERIEALNQEIINQKQLLAAHVRTHYLMGENHTMKWLFNNNDPTQLSRLLTFNQYIVKSRQNNIEKILITAKEIKQNKEQVDYELHNQQRLQQQIYHHQQQLEQNKHYHQAVIQSFNNEIQTKQHTLAEYEQNKKRLGQLLTQLLRNSATHPISNNGVPTNQSFSHLRKKLSYPVRVSRQYIQKMNQGVTFFTGEGAPVSAVYSGKVVFSDWLNGYGLLLIVDHGQGFMTLYAHNQSLFKQKGETVLKGQQIATVGHSGGIKQNGLYFEIRQNGKAVSPLQWFS